MPSYMQGGRSGQKVCIKLFTSVTVNSLLSRHPWELKKVSVSGTYKNNSLRGHQRKIGWMAAYRGVN